MAVLVELAGHRFAVQLSGAGAPEPVEGGLLLPAGRVAVLHGMGDAEFYRHGHNSWSPCGWRALSQPPLRIAGAPPTTRCGTTRTGTTPRPWPRCARRAAGYCCWARSAWTPRGWPP